MATITPGSTIGDINGSIGSVTFSRNRSGLIAKNKVTGKKTTTQKQKIFLQSDIAIINQWQSLILSQKQVWNDYADIHTKTNRFGKVQRLSGFNWFKSVNTSWFYVYGSYILIPPTYAYPNFLPTFIVSLTSDDIVIEWSNPVNPDDITLFIYTTPPIKGTARLSNANYRLLRKLSVDFSSSFSILSEWEQAHNLNWSEVSTSGKFLMNAQIFAINKATGITGTAMTAVGALVRSGLGAMRLDSTFILQ
ncbi:MAG: hypothetical protein V4549_03255 [Bacteroidota bacterium]